MCNIIIIIRLLPFQTSRHSSEFSLSSSHLTVVSAKSMSTPAIVTPAVWLIITRVVLIDDIADNMRQAWSIVVATIPTTAVTPAIIARMGVVIRLVVVVASPSEPMLQVMSSNRL